MAVLILRSFKESALTEEEMDGNLIYLKENAQVTAGFPSSVSVGAISAGDTIPQFSNLNDFVRQLLIKSFNPTLVAPSFSLSNNAGSLREIGEVISSIALNFTFNRGSILGANNPIVWDPATLQNPRAGIATSYTINSITQAGNSLNVVNHVVIQGNNTFTGTVNYAQGPQPLDSDGNPYSGPLSAGVSPTQTTSFEGVYPIFATTASIGSLTKQSLFSMISGNNIEITLSAESGGNKQKIDIPDSWLLSRPLTKIEYFNTVSNQYDTSNKLPDFSVSTVSQTVQSNTVSYKRYTNISPDRGALKMRLIF